MFLLLMLGKGAKYKRRFLTTVGDISLLDKYSVLYVLNQGAE